MDSYGILCLVASILIYTAAVDAKTSKLKINKMLNCIGRQCDHGPAEYKPVCGTNAVTYNNMCSFYRARCQDKSIKFHHKGNCRGKCVGSVCAKIYKPVCGTNGVTYGNDCLFRNAYCKDMSIGLLHKGKCRVKPCIPPLYCTKEYKPVCGSNGVTYSNYCMLKVARCKDKRIRRAHNGPCSGCKKPVKCLVNPCMYTKCSKGTVCVPNYCNGCFAQCKGRLCDDWICTADYSPVCGTNGVTYSNDCWLKNAQCRDKSIKLLHKGKCGEESCLHLACTKQYKPVCGSNGVTYGNLCMLKKAQCKNNRIKVAYNGTCSGCKKPAKCLVNPCIYTRCASNFICVPNYCSGCFAQCKPKPQRCLVDPCSYNRCPYGTACVTNHRYCTSACRSKFLGYSR